MQYSQILDIKISRLGLGTVKFGRNFGVKYPTQFELPQNDALIELLETAQALGINHLDTAPAYGLSEARLGDLFKNHQDFARKNWVLSSKVGEYYRNHSLGFDFSLKGMEKSLKQSLKTLGTDYLDILYLHSDGNEEALLSDELINWFQVQKKAGHVRAIGASLKTAEACMKAANNFDVLMVTFNRNDQNMLPCIQELKKRNTPIVIKKPLASGHISSGTIKTETSADHLNFVIEKTNPEVIISGTLNPSHLAQNASVFK